VVVGGGGGHWWWPVVFGGGDDDGGVRGGDGGWWGCVESRKMTKKHSCMMLAMVEDRASIDLESASCSVRSEWT
jgi:hypothetical protein